MKMYIAKSITGIIALTTLVVPFVASGKIKYSAAGSIAPSAFAVTGVLANNPFYRFVGTASYFKEKVAKDKLEARGEIMNEYASRLLRSYQVNAKNEKLINKALVDYESSVASYRDALLFKLENEKEAVNIEEHFSICMKHLRLIDEVGGWKELGSAQQGLAANIGDTFGELVIKLLESSEVSNTILSSYRDVALTRATISEQLRLAETLNVFSTIAMWKNKPLISAASASYYGELIAKISSAPENDVIKVLIDAVGSKKTRFETVSAITKLEPFAQNQELLDLKARLQEEI
jgi:hypothetical protein